MILMAFFSAFNFHFYRPQTKFVKVMFLHLSVSYSIHGGRWYPSMHFRWYPSMPCSRFRGGGGGRWYTSMSCRFPGPHPGGKLRILARRRVSRPTPKGKLRGLAWGGLQATTWGGLQAHTWGVSRPASGGVSRPTPRGCASQHALRQTPLDSYCCGWYASYWNAFLFLSRFYRFFKFHLNKGLGNLLRILRNYSGVNFHNVHYYY